MPSKIVALWCWYHGGAFRGYQTQREGPTVQDTLQTAFRSAGLERNAVPAGRTDRGVHARMQVVSMRVPKDLALEPLGAQLNALLPERAVGIAAVREAPKGFHAQFGNAGKEYRYRLLLEDDPAWAENAWRVDVDVAKVSELLSLCVGSRDFTAFHDPASAVKQRTVLSTEVVKLGGRVDLRLRGLGFGKYMVRLLVGGAVGVARGEIAEDDFRKGLSHARRFEGQRAPAKGLTLWEVSYPKEIDPFSEVDRRAASGVPATPPFSS